MLPCSMDSGGLASAKTVLHIGGYQTSMVLHTDSHKEMNGLLETRPTIAPSI